MPDADEPAAAALAEGLAALREDAGAIRTAIAAMAGEVAAQTAALSARAQSADRIAALHAQIDRQREAAERDLFAVRKALAETSGRLAQAETDAFTARADAARLPDALARAAALENELNALRYRFEQSEATLARFRRSFSWKVTQPLRWIGRTWKKLAGRRPS